jgi:hypothetical protein
MAHMWYIAADGSWAPAALDDTAFVLGSFGLARLADPREAVPASPVVVLRRTVGEPDTSWSLLIPAAVPVLVNGAPSPLGLVVLADRDEIRVPGLPPVFFSTETLAAIVPFPAGAPRGFCPRCKQPIELGASAVSCPDCGLWYHQSDTLPCWTYGDRCAACARPTPLDTGFSWTPEEV